MMEESAKLVSLGMPTQLALEVARQIADGANAPNLVRLGVPTQLAKELAWQIANGADVENLASLGMPTQLAVEVARQMDGSGGALGRIASAYNVTFDAGQDVGIKGINNGFEVWSDLGGYRISALRFDTGAASGRSSNRARRYIQSVNLYPANTITFSGAWSALTSAGVGYGAQYCGGRSMTSLVTNNYAQVDVTGEGDLYVVYTGRTDAGIARVDINGSQTLVNELTDLGGGYKAFDTKTATDLDRRRFVKVASGLPAGTYTVRVSVAGATTAVSNRIYVEAVAINQRPSLATRIEPPQWTSGIAVLAGMEFQNAGYFYRVTTDGTTGATAPTHSSGSGTDGTLTYNAFPYSSWHFDERYTSYGSEREHASLVTIGGVTGEVGGQTHGNETGTETVTMDGSPITVGSLSKSAIVWGSRIDIANSLTWVHPSDATAATVTLNRVLKPGRYSITGSWLCTTTTMDLGWSYFNGMLPSVVWNGQYSTPGYSEVKTDDGTTYTLADYSGTTTDIEKANVSAVAYMAEYSKRLVTAVSTTQPQSLLLRTNVGGDVYGVAGLANNWETKAYFERATVSLPETALDGKVITWATEHIEGVGA